MRRWRVLCVAASVLLATGCSATKLAYNNLDAMVSWQVGKFVELSGPSEELFDAGFHTLWAWHRKTQLPLYAADLRELGEAAQHPMSVEQIKRFQARAQAHLDRALTQGLPDGVGVLVALDDAQVAELCQRMAERRDERATKRISRTQPEARTEARERFEEGLERWLGRLTPGQKARVAAWADGVLLDPEAEAAAGQAWGRAWDALLRDRSAPDFSERLVHLLEYREQKGREAVNAIYAYNELTAVAVLSELSGELTPRQRQHFKDKLEGLAADFEQLAAQAP